MTYLWIFVTFFPKEIGELRALALEALQTATALGEFRNMAVAGGSIPEQLGKKDQGKIR